MEHLTVEEIMEFVSADELNGETLNLASKVNTHIGNCNECLRKVRAYQVVYDEFLKMNINKTGSRTESPSEEYDYNR